MKTRRRGALTVVRDRLGRALPVHLGQPRACWADAQEQRRLLGGDLFQRLAGRLQGVLGECCEPLGHRELRAEPRAMEDGHRVAFTTDERGGRAEPDAGARERRRGGSA